MIPAGGRPVSQAALGALVVALLAQFVRQDAAPQAERTKPKTLAQLLPRPGAA